MLGVYLIVHHPSFAMMCLAISSLKCSPWGVCIIQWFNPTYIRLTRLVWERFSKLGQAFHDHLVYEIAATAIERSYVQTDRQSLDVSELWWRELALLSPLVGDSWSHNNPSLDSGVIVTGFGGEAQTIIYSTGRFVDWVLREQSDHLFHLFYFCIRTASG